MNATSAAVTAKAPRKAAPLAIHGGEKVRKTPMPARLALGDAEVDMINRVVAYYRQRQVDPGYQGVFEKRYTDLFVEMMGGGYADAVATGAKNANAKTARRNAAISRHECPAAMCPIDAESASERSATE